MLKLLSSLRSQQNWDAALCKFREVGQKIAIKSNSRELLNIKIVKLFVLDQITAAIQSDDKR